jgi:hypothetical protein
MNMEALSIHCEKILQSGFLPLQKSSFTFTPQSHFPHGLDDLPFMQS